MPSPTDLKLFAWLTTVMSRDGLPATMLVVGETGVACCLGEVNPECSTITRGEKPGELA